MNILILIASLMGTGTWFYASRWAWINKARMLATGFGLAGLNSILFAFSSANGFPLWLTQTGVIVETPIIALILGGTILHHSHQRIRLTHELLSTILDTRCK